MAYQNVGTPRFYIDVFSYLQSIGLVESKTDKISVGLNPSESKTFTMDAQANFFGVSFSGKIPLGLFQNKDGKTVYALLGHNCSSSNVNWNVKVRNLIGGTWYEDYGAEEGGYVEIINKGRGGSQFNEPDYDGFSIYEILHGDVGHVVNGEVKSMQLRFQLPTETTPYPTLELGSLFIGTYYDMPHSPDLSLKMSIEMDGVKNIKTRGGASLTGINYTKPQNWGDMGAWQLSSTLEDGAQSLVPSNLRNGRRVWDLSFSYLSDTDVMPKVAATSNYEAGEYEVSNPNENTLLDGTDFFSQVWNKTMGGHLPFIFQPNGGTNGNNNPDQFAIARFDMNSLTYEQVAYKIYNVKLKIRECW